MKLGFGPKYFLKCVLTDSVNNSILKKIDFGLNGPDRVTYATLRKVGIGIMCQWVGSLQINLLKHAIGKYIR